MIEKENRSLEKPAAGSAATIPPLTARLASLEQLRKTTVTAFLAPAPPIATLRAWFDRARIPRFKANPAARRGGGPVYYSVAAVERLLRRTTLGNIDLQ